VADEARGLSLTPPQETKCTSTLFDLLAYFSYLDMLKQVLSVFGVGWIISTDNVGTVPATTLRLVSSTAFVLHCY
jgi:hypothetical protein